MKNKMPKRIKIPVHGTIDETCRAILAEHERRHKGMLLSEIVDAHIRAIQQMSPQERARYRQAARKALGLPSVSEPDAWSN
jgi:hypothetical protein